MNKISSLLKDSIAEEFGSERFHASELRGFLWHKYQINRRESQLFIKVLFMSGCLKYDGRKRLYLNWEAKA